jgi:hypothetical protein
MTPYSKELRRVVGLPTECSRAKVIDRGRGEMWMDGIYQSGEEGFIPMIEQNPLDLRDVSPPNGRDIPTRPFGEGRFSDDLIFTQQTLLPRDGQKPEIGRGRFVASCPSQFSAVFVMQYL